VALASLLVGGALASESLAPLADRVPRSFVVAGIMLLMSAPLDLSRALACKGALSAAATGIAFNAGVAAPFAWLVSRPLSEPLAIGLVVAAMAPCTLAAAAVWTRRGGGNEAVALLITVVTNLGCFLILPAWTALLLGAGQGGGESGIDTAALSMRLLTIVVIPILVGQALRKLSAVRYWCDTHRVGMRVVAQIGLLSIVFVGAVRCGTLLNGSIDIGWQDIAGLLLAVVVVHGVLFAASWWVARKSGCTRADALPAALGGSQKTLAVGLDVAITFSQVTGLGLVILPMGVYHATQLLLDAVLVARLRPTARRKN
jgi:sodium/bile acid cotransporter 7